MIARPEEDGSTGADLNDSSSESDETPRRRITLTVKNPLVRALEEFEADKNGSEWGVLEALAGAVWSGRQIDPRFQAVANAIITKSILFGRLPPRYIGRPKGKSDINGINVAKDYFEMRDAGVNYKDAIGALSERYHKDERHLMRIIRDNKLAVGLTIDERNKKRANERMFHELLKNVDITASSYSQKLVEFCKSDKDPTFEECAEMAEELIDKALAMPPSTDTK